MAERNCYFRGSTGPQAFAVNGTFCEDATPQGPGGLSKGARQVAPSEKKSSPAKPGQWSQRNLFFRLAIYLDSCLD